MSYPSLLLKELFNLLDKRFPFNRQKLLATKFNNRFAVKEVHRYAIVFHFMFSKFSLAHWNKIGIFASEEFTTEYVPDVESRDVKSITR